MTEHQARRWIREHWATFMWHADTPDGDVPELVHELWVEESRRMSSKLMPYSKPKQYGRAALAKSRETE